MILITVGSSNFEFNRLFMMIDELCEEGVLMKDEIIAQTGNISYKIKNYSHFNFINNEIMEQYIEKANLIISHSGTGTVIKSLKKNKKVIIVPRRKKYNEHIDDHQLELANSFLMSNYLKVANNKAELKKSILEIDSFIPKKFISNNEKFKKLIVKILEENAKQ